MLIVALGLLVSGCTQPDSEEPLGVPSEPPTISAWTLDECFGFATYEPSLPLGPRGTAPPGWQFDSSTEARFASQASLSLVVCNRLNMLGFERGPVALLMDTHTNFTSPDTCENGKFDYMEVLSMLWVDDAALAEALRALGIQAGVMEIDFQSDNGTPLHQRWTVETEAGISEIEVVAPTYSSNVGSPLILRVVSWNGNRLSLLDFGYGPAETPIVDGNLAMGTLSKGFLMSGTTDRDFVARADVYIRQTASVSVSQFNDSLCTDPVIGP